ncbi:MAG: hypothetical protein LQ340_001213 [Diploschistes diacapsis]|nr:MAG: hypothetical protein LQ340_001213 [Diploschistes diacapsis]
MLYEFHRQQNSKKPGSVHATYLLTGTQIVTSSSDAMNGVADGDGDITMQSSPYMSSPIHSEKPPEEPLKQQVITLAREEHLDAVKKKYAEISSIHMYSLGPSTIKNLQILSNVTQGIVAEFASEDPLVHNKTYGVIQNPNVKARARPPIPVPVARAPPKASHGSQKQTTKFTSKESTPALSTQTKPKQEGKNEPMAKSSKSPPVPVKREKSDLFKAFAKSQPKVRREDTGSSVASREASRPETPDDQQDAVMDDDSEEEELERLATNQESTALRDARLTREAKLKKMMEDDEGRLHIDH